MLVKLYKNKAIQVGLPCSQAITTYYLKSYHKVKCVCMRVYACEQTHPVWVMDLGKQ